MVHVGIGNQLSLRDRQNPGKANSIGARKRIEIHGFRSGSAGALEGGLQTRIQAIVDDQSSTLDGMSRKSRKSPGEISSAQTRTLVVPHPRAIAWSNPRKNGTLSFAL